MGLGELIAQGLLTCDSFGALRWLIVPPSKRRGPMSTVGRWSLFRRETLPPPEVEFTARQLLKRTGVVFRRTIEREKMPVPWRDLARVYRTLEARGEIRGGRFVSGFSGEQFALPEAVGKLRAVRRQDGSEELIAVSGADPLNLTGIVTPGPRVPSVSRNRVLYRAGIPVAALIAGRTLPLGPDVDLDAVTLSDRPAPPAGPPPLPPSLEQALVRRRVAPAVRAYLGSRG
jgi:ATP-dependent Lhr-like helicase